MSEHDRRETIKRLRALDPADASGASELIQRDSIRAAALAQLRGEESEAVGATSHIRSAAAAVPPRGWRPSGRFALGLGGTLVAAIGVAVVLVLVSGSSIRPGSTPQFAQAAIRNAQEGPRLLVGEAGWTVSNADQSKVDRGDIEFTNGAEKIDVDWEPDDLYNQLDIAQLRKQANGPPGSLGNPTLLDGKPAPQQRYERVDALGGAGVLSYLDGAGHYELVLPPKDGSYLQIYSDGDDANMSKQRFLEIVDSLHMVDVDTWLQALPRRIVKPVDHRAAVDGMLKGLPVPGDVDVEQLRSEDLAMDRYQLGARVSGAIACGWLDQWAGAVTSGDDQSAAQASDAMATSREWPILKEMASEGGWSQTVWEYAHDMKVDDREHLLGPAGTESVLGGPTYEIGPGYAVGLGCDSETRTLRPDK